VGYPKLGSASHYAGLATIFAITSAMSYKQTNSYTGLIVGNRRTTAIRPPIQRLKWLTELH
jgi:hypothetical protein